MADQENTEKGKIDLDKILLPKKEAGPSLDSAQRVNAGALLASEQGATLPKKPAPPPVAPPPKPAEQSVVKAVETYQSHIEQLVQKKNVSVVSMAAAEATRRGEMQPQTADAAAPAPGFFESPLLQRIGLVAGGLLFLMLSAALLFFIFRPPLPLIVTPQEEAPFVRVDDTVVFTVPSVLPAHSVIIATLDQQRTKVALSLGLMARFYLAQPSVTTEGTETLAPISTESALRMLAPNVPDELVRALDPVEYLLAVHVFDGNQPLLVLEAESYEQAYAGMLEWERTMQNELAPFFTRVPRARIPEEGIATSTPTTTTPFLGTSFTDDIIENQSARVIKNESGDLLLLWTFLDRNTILITTNEATLREVVSRLRSTPIVPTP